MHNIQFSVLNYTVWDHHKILPKIRGNNWQFICRIIKGKSKMRQEVVKQYHQFIWDTLWHSNWKLGYLYTLPIHYSHLVLFPSSMSALISSNDSTASLDRSSTYGPSRGCSRTLKLFLSPFGFSRSRTRSQYISI